MSGIPTEVPNTLVKHSWFPMVEHEAPVTAYTLGNPPEQLDAVVNRDISLTSLDDFRYLGGSCIDGEHPEQSYGRTLYGYKADQAIYDSGYLIIVQYSWNHEIEDCLENRILREVDAFGMHFLRDEIFPRISNLSPITCVKFVTTESSFSVVPATYNETIYPVIPSTLTLTRMPISQLRRLRRLEGSVDLVTVHGDTTNELYAFKYADRYPPEDFPGDTSANHILEELEYFLSVKSPFILMPQFVVEGADNDCFRGFLMSFLPAGSLSRVLKKLHGNPDRLLVPLQALAEVHPSETSHIRPLSFGLDDPMDTCSDFGGATKLTWNMKHKWAVEVASAVVTLHEANIYCGDIKSDNILLDRSGHLQLVDIAPVNGYTEQYAPPDLLATLATELPHSSSRDIFALGLVLWQIGSEVWSFYREFVDIQPVPLWREGTGVAPTWYRSLVEACIHADALSRPTAQDVLAVLKGAL